jgi:hypothetical protein
VASDDAQRRLGGIDWIGQGGLLGAQPGAGGGQRRGGAALQRLPQRCRRGDQQAFELVDRCGSGLDGTIAGRPERPDRLEDAVASLGRGGGHPGQHGAGGGLGVDRIRLAALAAGAPVRPVDLHDDDVLVEQEPGQAGAVAASAFDPDHVQVPVATQPAKQLSVATTVSRELPVA